MKYSWIFNILWFTKYIFNLNFPVGLWQKSYGYVMYHAVLLLVDQLVKNPPAMWETWVQSLGWEDPLEKGKATHSGITAWKIPWTI